MNCTLFNNDRPITSSNKREHTEQGARRYRMLWRGAQWYSSIWQSAACSDREPLPTTAVSISFDHLSHTLSGFANCTVATRLVG